MPNFLVNVWVSSKTTILWGFRVERFKNTVPQNFYHTSWLKVEGSSRCSQASGYQTMPKFLVNVWVISKTTMLRGFLVEQFKNTVPQIIYHVKISFECVGHLKNYNAMGFPHWAIQKYGPTNHLPYLVTLSGRKLKMFALCCYNL